MLDLRVMGGWALFSHSYRHTHGHRVSHHTPRLTHTYTPQAQLVRAQRFSRSEHTKLHTHFHNLYPINKPSHIHKQTHKCESPSNTDWKLEIKTKARLWIASYHTACLVFVVCIMQITEPTMQRTRPDRQSPGVPINRKQYYYSCDQTFLHKIVIC